MERKEGRERLVRERERESKDARDDGRLTKNPRNPPSRSSRSFTTATRLPSPFRTALHAFQPQSEPSLGRRRRRGDGAGRGEISKHDLFFFFFFFAIGSGRRFERMKIDGRRRACRGCCVVERGRGGGDGRVGRGGDGSDSDALGGLAAVRGKTERGDRRRKGMKIRSLLGDVTKIVNKSRERSPTPNGLCFPSPSRLVPALPPSLQKKKKKYETLTT